MTISYALLGLLEEADRHGYDLKQSYDRRFGATRPLRFGQVYRTLAQLQRDGCGDPARQRPLRVAAGSELSGKHRADGPGAYGPSGVDW